MSGRGVGASGYDEIEVGKFMSFESLALKQNRKILGKGAKAGVEKD